MIRKNILVFIDEEDYGDDFQDFIREIFDNQNLNIVSYKSEYNKFYLEGNVIEIDLLLAVSDYVYNFLSPSEEFNRVQRKIEVMKLGYFGNNLDNIKVFSEKINFKKIIEKSEFKTPVFEKIDDRTSVEIFNNFTQPSRIFSKNNNYCSNKIDSLGNIIEIFKKEISLDKYYIEEFIEGEELFVFVFANEENKLNILILAKKNNEYKKLDFELNSKIKKDIFEFFEKYNFKDFMLLNLINSEKRGLYFLNIWLRNIDLINKREIVEKILKEYDYTGLKRFLQKDLF